MQYFLVFSFSFRPPLGSIIFAVRVVGTVLPIVSSVMFLAWVWLRFLIVIGLSSFVFV